MGDYAMDLWTDERFRKGHKIGIIVSIIIGIVIGLCIVWFNNAFNSNLYIVDGVITSFDGEIATVETIDGNLWDYETDCAYINETVKIEFTTKGTESIFDDEIVNVIEKNT